MTLAALRRPAGKLSPIFSSFSRRHFPPFLDLALSKPANTCMKIKEFSSFNVTNESSSRTQACLHPSCEYTFSTRPPEGRHWGTRVGTVSSALPRLSLCTWRWSWAVTGVLVLSRTLRLCWLSHLRSGHPSPASESPCSYEAWELKNKGYVLKVVFSCRL